MAKKTVYLTADKIFTKEFAAKAYQKMIAFTSKTEEDPNEHVDIISVENTVPIFTFKVKKIELDNDAKLFQKLMTKGIKKEQGE
jgi:hypothetical protein